MLHALLLRTERNEVGERAAQLIVERIVCERRLLLNIADRVRAIHHDLPAVMLLASEQDAHERRLARAVCADQPHLVPALHLEIHMRKERTYAVRLFETNDLQTPHITLLHPRAQPRGDSRAR